MTDEIPEELRRIAANLEAACKDHTFKFDEAPPEVITFPPIKYTVIDLIVQDPDTSVSEGETST